MPDDRPLTDDRALSQLADGELGDRAAAETMRATPDDSDARERFNSHLRLRLLTADWRERTGPPATFLRMSVLRTSAPASRPAVGVLAATLAGGLLVLAGVWAGRQTAPETAAPLADFAPSEVISPDRRRQVAEVFAFHESVAGPLDWYAADDEAIRLGTSPPRNDDHAAGRPIAVVLRLAAGGSGAAHECVIVCCDGVPVTIPLPQRDPAAPSARLYLSPSLGREGVAEAAAGEVIR